MVIISDVRIIEGLYEHLIVAFHDFLAVIQFFLFHLFVCINQLNLKFNILGLFQLILLDLWPLEKTLIGLFF